MTLSFKIAGKLGRVLIKKCKLSLFLSHPRLKNRANRAKNNHKLLGLSSNKCDIHVFYARFSLLSILHISLFFSNACRIWVVFCDKVGTSNEKRPVMSVLPTSHGSRGTVFTFCAYGSNHSFNIC